MCRRGHSDRFVRHRRDGNRYCRRCATLQQIRRTQGLPPLTPLGTSRMPINRAAFKRACRRIDKGRLLVLELSGICGESLGAIYRYGLGPERRAALCETLHVKHDELWRINP